MSLADDWDAIPASGTAPAKAMSVSQDWEVTPVSAPAQTPLTAATAPKDSSFWQNFGKGTASVADTAINVIPMIANLGTYATSRALSKSPEASQQIANQVSSSIENPVGKALGITNDPAYQQEFSKKIVDFVGNYFHKGAQWIADQTGMNVNDAQNIMGSLSIAAPETLKIKGTGVRTPNEMESALPESQAQRQYQSLGAAGTTTSQTAASQGASPQLQAAIREAEKSGNINFDAAQRHIEAESLPVPIKLTEGQATQDVNLLSNEENLRAKYPDLAQRFNEQNDQLKQNINAIRDEAAPDVFHANHVEAGQALIDAYKEKDAAMKDEIAAKYKALSDANGGQIPLDGQTFVANANAALGKQMKGAYVPKEINSIMNDILEGKQTMTFENFENLRTILASDARKFERSGDGNAAQAVSIVRSALEDMPLSPEAANLKPLADDARTAAKQRFDLLKADPAYNDAVKDVTPADKFIGKYVIKAPVKNIISMKQNLADNELANQTISQGAINYLKDRAGIVRDEGNFSQAGYNKALEEVQPKLGFLVDPKIQDNLISLGNTARATQAKPRGSYVNVSNTLVGSLAGAVSGGMGTAVRAVPYVGEQLSQALIKRQMQGKIKNMLKPGAGIQK